MAFSGRTPEAALARNDSKNPATTCKGITSTGRPCRRELKAAKDALNNGGVLAVASVVGDDDEDETDVAIFYCWQHKDQAEQLAAAEATLPQRQNTRIYPLQQRSSIDTLVDRLGVIDLEEPGPSVPSTRRKRRESRTEGWSSSRPPRRVNRPPTWDQVQGPLMTVPHNLMAGGGTASQRPNENRPRPQWQQKGFWGSLCCVRADDDYVEVVRHKKRTGNPPSAMAEHRPSASMPLYAARLESTRPEQARPTGLPPTAILTTRPPSAQISYPNGDQPKRASVSPLLPARKPLQEKQARPLNKLVQNRATETSSLLAYISPNVSPTTTSALLTELSKPISRHDDEGYIYIFWLTEESAGPAPESTASSLLTPPSRPEQGRRTSDVMRQYSVRRSPQRPSSSTARPRAPSSKAVDTGRILLKIGRANNVHRRMTEWTRQCGYSLSLVRYYPYVPATPSASPSPRHSPAQSRRPSYQNQSRPSDPCRRISEGVRKVPHAHKVERLIHIELAGQRVRKNCEACGKEHREWFEVDATREGVKAVDEVVKRWVDWAERSSA